MIDGFDEKWPDVQVDVFRSGTEEVVSKVLAEKEAGSVLADVLLVADDVTFETLKEQDLLMAYESRAGGGPFRKPTLTRTICSRNQSDYHRASSTTPSCTDTISHQLRRPDK